MSRYFALINSEDIVETCVVVDDDTENVDSLLQTVREGEWVETFIGEGGVAFDPVTWEPLEGDCPRYNYAGPGYFYDRQADAFVSPQPYPSWTLNLNYVWEAPVPYPSDGNVYYWDENTQTWNLPPDYEVE